MFQDPDVVRCNYLLPMTEVGEAESWLAGRAAGWQDGSRTDERLHARITEPAPSTV